MIVALEQELLTPACVERVVQKVLIRAVPTGAALEQARATLSQDLTDVRGEVENLIESLAKVGVSSAPDGGAEGPRGARGAARARAGRPRAPRAGFSDRGEPARSDRSQQGHGVARATAPARTAARQTLAKMLRGKLVVRPEQRDGQRGYRFTGEGSILPLLTGLVRSFHKRWRPQREPCLVTSLFSAGMGGFAPPHR